MIHLKIIINNNLPSNKLINYHFLLLINDARYYKFLIFWNKKDELIHIQNLIKELQI